MRPPICAVCNIRFSATDGGMVRFADFTPLPEGRVGHPNGLEWFCEAHIEPARALSGETTKAAVAALRKP